MFYLTVAVGQHHCFNPALWNKYIEPSSSDNHRKNLVRGKKKQKKNVQQLQQQNDRKHKETLTIFKINSCWKRRSETTGKTWNLGQNLDVAGHSQKTWRHNTAVPVLSGVCTVFDHINMLTQIRFQSSLRPCPSRSRFQDSIISRVWAFLEIKSF